MHPAVAEPTFCKDDDEPDDFMEIPEGIVGKVIWGLCLIVYIPMYLTLPGAYPCKFSMSLDRSCASHALFTITIAIITITITIIITSTITLRPWPSKGSKFYMVTFFLSLLWIAAFSFPLVWLTETACPLETLH